MKLVIALSKILGISLLLLVSVLVVSIAWLYYFLTVFENTPSSTTLKPAISETLGRGVPLSNTVQWEAQKPYVRELFEDHVYGPFPATDMSLNHNWRLIDSTAYGGKGVAEELILSDNTGTLKIPIVLVTPAHKQPAPLIIASSFCALHNAFPEYEIERPLNYPTLCDDEEMEPIKHAILGEYIDTFPVEDILDQGFALAVFYTGSVAPDSAEAAPAALERLSSLASREIEGVVSAWAFGYTTVMHALETDPRIDVSQIALYGHSRDGKAALLAGAFDESVDAVIAHQSGLGGAAPAGHRVGESITAIMKEYPHWFAPSFLAYAGREDELPIDQHFLLALMAPRPLLLTGARQDKWADPAGAFQAARDASFVYDLYAPGSFTAKTLEDFNPTDTLAFFMRPLNHGVRQADWSAILLFLRAHFAR